MEAFASPAAELVYVGKRGLQKSVKQHQIDGLLVDWCLKVSCTVPVGCTFPVSCTLPVEPRPPPRPRYYLFFKRKFLKEHHVLPRDTKVASASVGEGCQL